MSERKTIQINPELFQIASSSRKKQPKSEEGKIKIKSNFKTQKQKTLRKNVLRLIREKQQEAYRDLFDAKHNRKQTNSSIPSSEASFNKDFEDSLNFFSSLATKIDAEEKPSFNTTIKNTSSIHSMPEIHTSLPETFIQTPSVNDSISIKPVPRILPPPPKYGCLKNGTLPTYRSYTRHISSGYETPDIAINTDNNYSYPAPPLSTPIIPFETPTAPNSSISDIEKMQKFEKIHGGTISTENKKPENRIKYLKRKKIFKRTYHVGRSRNAIGVLVSNKTIRTRISTQAQLLKQTPIQEVRKFLIKKGFIKVGTNAPNDVLRKMYESVSLVCGEIQNHNQENLLYNFIHDKEN
jgi:hypothetical protein